MNNFLKKRIVIAIIICAGLTESTTYAGTCRVFHPMENIPYNTSPRNE